VGQQRENLPQQIDSILNNPMAQLYNGEIPDAMPDAETIRFAYARLGDHADRQLDVALDNARLFQTIQYADTQQQQTALADARPQVNDPDYALKLEAFGKLITDAVLLRAAGWAQSQAGTSLAEFGGWYGLSPFGDDPDD
jgi:hypothetical protein